MTSKTKLAAARDAISGVINKINGDTKLPSNIIGYWGDDLRKALSILDQAIGEETDVKIGYMTTREITKAHPPAVDWIEGLRKTQILDGEPFLKVQGWNAALDAVKEGMK